MSGTFRKPQPEETGDPDHRRPVWVWVIAAVDLLRVLQVIPLIALIAAPVFVVYYIYVVYGMVWASPVLLAVNAVLFGWSVHRRPTGMAVLATFSVLLVLLSGVLLVLWGAPLTVFG